MVIGFDTATKKVLWSSGETLVYFSEINWIEPFQELAETGAGWPVGVDPDKAYWDGTNIVELTDAEINERKPLRWNDIYSVDWVVNGNIALGQEVDCGRLAINGQIACVQVARGKSGNLGQTVVDVNINGTTIFTDQGKRPKVLASEGDNTGAEVTDIDVRDLHRLDYLTVDVDETEVGPADNLHVRVLVKPAGTY